MSDKQHHVAKLVTSGTPHLGSNLTSYGFLQIVGLDENSEAVRDFRTNVGITLTDQITVKTKPKPATPAISPTRDGLTSSAATSNQWYKDEVLLTGETAQKIKSYGPGVYIVEVTETAARAKQPHR